MLSERFLANSEIFYTNPEDYIYSLLGNEVQNMTYEVQDCILPGNQIVVDVHYNKQISPSLETIFVSTKDLKRLNNQNETYIFEYGDSKIPVCLIASRNSFQNRDKFPVNIYEYNKGDKFYSYLARIKPEPLHAYSTVVPSNFSIKNAWPDLKKEVDITKVKEKYDDKETIEAYKAEVAKFDSFRSVNKISLIKDFKETFDAKANIGFVMKYTSLPDTDVFGHIVIVPHRRSDLLFYYPNSANVIYADEISFIKDFMKFDSSNLIE